MSKSETYRRLHEDLRALLAEERDLAANAANTAALVYQTLADVNWAGFYLLRGGDLVLGPFQGKPACTRIALGRGVCGTAAQERRTVVVHDVHRFPGHIACDPQSRSEIVVPLLDQDRLLGVLDLDSPLPGRFDEEDRKGLEAAAAALLAASDLHAGAGGSTAGTEDFQETTAMSPASPERRPIEQVLHEHAARWMSIPGVAGCGVGRKGDEPCIVVFAARRTPELAAGIPGAVETYPVVIEETGPFRAL